MKNLGKNFAYSVQKNWHFSEMVICLMGLLALSVISNAHAASYPAPAEVQGKTPVMMVIKEVRYDEKKAVAIAEGRVEVQQGSITVDADRITYNLADGTVHANGHVSIMDASGNVTFQDNTLLTNSMAQGVVQQFHVLLRHNEKFIAREAANPAGNTASPSEGYYTAAPAAAIPLPEASSTTQSLNLPFMETGKTEKPKFIAARKLPNCDELTTPSKPLSLMEALHWALCHNPDTRVMWASALSQGDQVGINRAAYYPTATLGENFQATRSNTNGPPDQPFISGTGNSGTIIQNGPTSTTTSEYWEGPTLSINYLLYDFGARSATLDASKQSALASLFTYYTSVQQVVLNTIQSYYALQLANASADAARQTLSFNQVAQQIADTKHTLGINPIADKLQANTATAQTEINIQTLEQQVALQQGNLARAMGIAPQTPLILPEEAPTLFKNDLDDSRISEMVDEALKNRPDLRTAKANELAAKAQIRSADAQDYPQINLNLTQDEYYNTRPQNFHEFDSSAVVSVNFPLFTGFKNTYTREAARHTYEEKTAAREQLEQDIGLDVWNNYQDYKTARTNIGLVDKLVVSARQNNDVALGRYKEGVGTILDALNAQSQLAEALLQQAKAQYEVQIQRVKLASAMGLLYQSVQPSGAQ